MLFHANIRASVVLAGAFLLSIIQAQASPPAGYLLDWSDEFNGSVLDTSKWDYRALGPRNDAVNTMSAVTVTNGALTITTYTERGTNFTGMIGTENHYLPRYGYIEARINFNDSPGEWSAFWMQTPTIDLVGDPHAYGTEMDIVEHRAVNANGKSISDTAVSNIHWDGYGTEHKTVGSPRAGTGLSTGWHLYAVQWMADIQNYYYDGELVWAVTNSAAVDPVPPEAPVSQRSQYFILSSEVRDTNWAGSISSGGYGDRTTSVTRMNVDYVRAYSAQIPPPILVASRFGPGKVAVTLYGMPGVNYVLERSTELAAWTNVATNIAPAGGLITYTNFAVGEAAFYRARCN